MRFICSTFGSAGDVFPMLGLALELQHRGHEVTLATNEYFADVVTANGVAFEPVGSADAFQASVRSPDLWHPQRAFRHVFSFLSPALREQYALHARHAGDTDVVGITNCFGFGALVAQEKLGIPVITLHLQPAVLWSRFAPPTVPGVFGPRWLKSFLYGLGERLVLDPVVCPFLNDWRTELGLPPMNRITRWWNSPFGVLCMFPRWFAPPQPDWPANLMQTDFPLWNRKGSVAVDDALETFLAAGDPPIVFTPGSANVHGREFFEAAIAACHMLGRRGILLTEFPEQIPEGVPESILHRRYVPLDELLPRACGFVHHGGIGSTSQAMLAGIPQLLTPLAHDQFDNASRLRRLGIGGEISSRGLTGRGLAKALRPLLESRSVTEACHAVAQRLSSRDGLRQSAIAVEERVSRLMC
jgi:UDP:flavonoid glycosyltransferase YjiC (YdhE family)